MQNFDNLLLCIYLFRVITSSSIFARYDTEDNKYSLNGVEINLAQPPRDKYLKDYQNVYNQIAKKFEMKLIMMKVLAVMQFL